MTIILPNREEIKKEFLDKVRSLYPEAQVIISYDGEGKGKGWAIRQGLAKAESDLICFLDGDGDIEPKMIKRLIPFIEDYDIVVGVKPISGLWSRRILTFFSRYYIALFFGIKVDSQTGIKLFKKEALTRWYNNGFLFDLEILSLAKQKGLRMIEVPIEADVKKRMKLISIWNTFKESITLWLELR